MARIKSVGDKGTLCVSGVRECWKRIFGKDCRRFGGIGFDGFGLSGILMKKIIKKIN
jgi:hypothetical protein